MYSPAEGPRGPGCAVAFRTRAHGERLEDVQVSRRAHDLPPRVSILREIRERRCDEQNTRDVTLIARTKIK